MWAEWPLALFTLSLQMGVGLFCTGESLDWLYSHRYGFAGYRPIRIRVRSAAAALTGISLITSFFHLGSPLKAVMALSNIKKSWLSREILLLLVFVSVVLFLLLVIRLSRAYRGLQGLIALMGGAAGILLIAAMSKIYMLPAVPLWNRITTPLSFFVDTLLLGGLASAVLFLSRPITGNDVEGEHNQSSVRRNNRFIPASALGALLFLATGAGLTWALASKAQLHAESSPLWQTGEQAGIILALRFLSALVGALMLLIAIFKSRRAAEKGVLKLFFAALLVILLSEILARFYFYTLPFYGRL